MDNFIFDLQRFDAEISDGKVTIPANETFTLNNIAFTAGDSGAVLTAETSLNDEIYSAQKISGIESGNVTVTIDGASDSPAIIFDGSTAFDFTCKKSSTVTGTDIINVGYQNRSLSYTSGSVTYSSTSIAFPAGDIGLAGTIANFVPYNINLNVPDSGATVTFNDGNLNFKSDDGTVTADMTFPAEITTLLKNLKGILPTILIISEDSFEKLYDVVTQLVSGTTTIALSGEANYNRDAKSFSFAENSVANINILGYGAKFTAVDGAVDGMSVYYSKTDDGINAGIKFVPNSGGGKLGVDLSKDGETLFNDTIEVTSGVLTLDPINSKLSTEANTSFTMHVRNVYTATLASDDAINVGFSADENGNIVLTPDAVPFTFTLQRDDIIVFSGTFLINGGSLLFNGDTHSITMTKGTKATVTYDKYEISLTANDDAGIKIVANENGTYSFTPGKNDGSLGISISQDGTTLFNGALNITNGSISFDPKTQEISLTEGTKFTISMGTDNQQENAANVLDGSANVIENANSTETNNQRQIDMKVVNGSASVKVTMDADGNFEITPTENDGKLEIAISTDGTTNFQNTLNINGSIILNIAEQSINLADKTTITATFKNYEVTAMASGNTASTVALVENGLSVEPNTSDGTLDITLTGAGKSISANMEVLSGRFLFELDGSLSVTKGTELKLDFGDGYIINFKANDAAGGKISLGTDGITFAPGSDDGGLQLSITRDGETRSASLDVTGSVTYKLDGSISLTKGTVVKNVFDSGNILTITANTDASGSITFNPQTGLIITPSTADALNVVLSNSDGLDVVNISSINGSINYNGGVVTASKGTTARLKVYGTWESELRTTGGSASLQFLTDRTVYTANEDATFVLDYLDDTTFEIQGGSFSDIYATETSDAIELVTEGSIFRANDEEFIFTLEKAGNYNLNGMDITTSKDNTQVVLGGDYDTVTFAADAGITVSTTEDKGFRFALVDSDGNIKVTSTESGDFGVSSGSITFGEEEFSITKGTIISLARGEQTITLTATEDISAPIKVEEEIYYLDFDDITASVSVTQDEQTIFGGELEIGGVFSYRPETKTFGLTGANSSHGDGTNTFAQFTAPNGYGVKMETNDTTIVFVPTFADGKLSFNFPNEAKHAMKFTLSKDGQTTFENNIAVDGTVGFDTTTQEISLTKDTVLTLTQGENAIEITALNDAGGKLTFVESGIRFAPNEGDGELELNFVTTDRKANLNITGAIILGNDGKISLEDGTEATFVWEDGTNLKLTSTGSTGSIGIDEKGIKITSDDENLSIDLTIATGDQTHLSGIKGTIYYNAGKISFDDNSTITATTTLGGQPILMTLETIGGTGYLEFASNGVIYSADTGAMKITWSKDDLESTFIVNSGSIQIGHGLFQIAEGTDLATDLKDFVPALYFTTSEAGTYTINGHTITTTAENISMTATDDYMTFVTSDDAVTYDGMTFAGAGNVSLSSSGVVLGAGVVATGFGLDESFILAEAGNVTADARIFELSKIEDVPREIPMIITVTGAQDGFIFSRTLTKESEAYLEDALSDEAFENYSSSYIGKVFTEKFIAAGDSSYRIRTDAIGLEEVIGISKDTTVTGGASLNDEPTLSYYNLVTDTEGTFTIGEKSYTISGDSSVAITARFDEDSSAYASAFDSLNGTVSGDFTEHAISINGGASILIIGDTSVSVVADDSGYEILGLDDDASVKVSAAGTYKVNGINFNAKAGDYITTSKGGYNIINDFDSDEIVTITSGGNQDIDLSKVDYDVAYIEADATGKKDVKLGGGNLVVVEDTGAKVNITASKGNDTIVSTGENVFVKMNSKGATDIFANGGKMTIEGYDPSTDSGFHTDYDDILTAINERNIVSNKGKLTIGAAVIDGVNNLANIFNADGDLQKVGDATQDEALDLSKETADIIATANENSTITTGKGNDTVLADTGSHIDAGEGKNYIEMEERGANEDGAEIVVRSGKNTVANFTAGFDDTSDRLFVGVNDTVDFKFDGTDLKAYTNGKLRGVVSEVGDGASFVNFLAADNNSTSKIVAMQEGATVTVDDEIADLYIGKKSGIDFNNYEENLYINLGTEETSVGAGEVLFSGINQITVGSGLNTLMGSSANETLSGNADGVTEFVFKAGGGRDVIQNFNFDVDKINVGKDKVTNVVLNSAGNVRMQVGDGNDWLTLEDAQGKNFKINDFIAQVNSDSLTYDGNANFFVATGKNASITVDNETVTDAAIIWLGNQGTSQFIGDIRTLDASNFDSRAELAGNDTDNTIIGGSGNNSLWGGNGGDDLLQGGTGKNMFFYALGNGDDTITGANDGDVVYLSGITLEQIAGSNFTDGAVVVRFIDGGQLTVNDDGKAVNFVVGEQTFRVNGERTDFIIETNA